jgi:SPP1 family phage portal protein
MTEKHVYDTTVIESGENVVLNSELWLHGRRQIFTGEKEITRGNVLDVLNKALGIHLLNRKEIVYLERYCRGIQPIMHRIKEYHTEINNKIVVNVANQIVTFKTAEFAGEPIQYVSRGGVDEDIPEKVAKLNTMMLTEGKQSKDMELANRMFKGGVAYRLTIHDQGRTGDEVFDEAPFETYVPDPKNTFVVRQNDVSKRVLMGVTYVYLEPPERSIRFTVYTKDEVFTIDGVYGGALEITDVTRHNFGIVPLVEYPCNPDYMSPVEVVLPLLDAISNIQSNRLDGVEQFIQAIMVFEGVDITREQLTELKDLGALKIPPTMNGQTGRVYYLNEQLDQSQTQTLVDDLYQTVLEIVGMPGQGNGNTSDSSNNGAMIIKNGWWHSEARALETEAMWKAAETEFLKIVLKICSQTGELEGLKVSDVEPKFGRRSYEDLQVKTQAFMNLRSGGCPPIQAFKFSKLSRDPESDAQEYEEYQERQIAEAAAQAGIEDDSLLGVGIAGGGSGVVGGGGASTEADDIPEDDDANPANKKYGVCPICGTRFEKHSNVQKYDKAKCRRLANRGQE